MSEKSQRARLAEARKAARDAQSEQREAARARDSLRKVAGRPGIAGLSAVKAGRAHGFSHQLLNSPLDIVAIEAFARWIHPELFVDIDPQATLDTINRAFLSVPYTGTWWIDLAPLSPEPNAEKDRTS